MTSAFWAPTRSDLIENALNLARLKKGESFVDLGCGDGRVLLAAARRGATVTGIEIDPARAKQARELLEGAGFAVNIVVGDVARTHVRADVVFAFLSPATLQRLAPRLSQLARGTRLIFPEFGVEGWEPEQVHRQCFLYRTPPRIAQNVCALGWESAGVLAGLRAGGTSLISVTVTHPQGRVTVDTVGALKHFTTATPGIEFLDVPRRVVVDLEWRPRPAGTVVTGRLECVGVGSCQIYGVYTDGPIGIWGLANLNHCSHVAALLAHAGREPELVLNTARRRISAGRSSRSGSHGATHIAGSASLERRGDRRRRCC
jgi:SAM-dependent methyltransferase